MIEGTYQVWALKRLTKRMLCYFVVAPLLLILWPFMALGNWLYGVFRHCREW